MFLGDATCSSGLIGLPDVAQTIGIHATLRQSGANPHPAEPVTVTGEIRDTTWFVATNVIRVINPTLKTPNGGNYVSVGAEVEITWDNLSSQLHSIVNDLEQLSGGLGELEGFDIPDLEGTVQDCTGYFVRLRELREQLNACISEPSSSDSSISTTPPATAWTRLSATARWPWPGAAP